MHPYPEPFFLQVDAGPLGHRFALYHKPQRGTCGLVVHAHPFAEEMNKSRRMAALQSRALAAEGFAVLQIDLLGCGDSAGDFGDATWAQWVTDVVTACRWLRQRHGGDNADAAALPLWIWGHRSGALLAVQAAQHLGTSCHLLLWQPAASGKAVLQQFLRLRLAGDMMSGQAKTAMTQMRGALAAGRAVEVAGYLLHPALCQGLEHALLQPPNSPAGRVEWFELSKQDDASLTPAASPQASRWSEAGWALRAHRVKGPSFWQTTEIEDAPALLQATVTALASDGREPAVSSASAATEQTMKLTPTTHEQALIFASHGEALVGVLHHPPPRIPQLAMEMGVVVIVGGPQYRAGSHRQFVHLARVLASSGHAVLRFDVQGMGDSTGDLHGFEQIAPDIGAAIDALQQHAPQVRQVVLWGLCDGASAALLYLHERDDARVRGLCLLNPWVRSEATLARAHVKHYYLQRIRQREFWAKVLRGGVGLEAVGALLRNARQAVGVGSEHRDDRKQEGQIPFQQRMARALRDFPGEVLLLLSGRDLTAREFIEFAAIDDSWRGLLVRKALQRHDLDSADHTFSDSKSREWSEQLTVQWLTALPSPLATVQAMRAPILEQRP